MKCYHFSNMYLSSIQVGIQAAHAQTELFLKYNASSIPTEQIKIDAINDLYDWAENFKTIVCLSAGTDYNLNTLADMLGTSDNTYAWAFFEESKEALNGLLTNVAIVLPEIIYETAKWLRKRNNTLDFNYTDKNYYDEYGNTFTQFEFRLIEFINNCPVAR